jgi:hypothetical protein
MKVPIQRQSTNDVKKQPPRWSKVVRNARYPEKPRPQSPPGIDSLVGRRIAAVRAMTKAELTREGWDEPRLTVKLDDGTLLYPSQDYEGNTPGALFGFSRGQTAAYSCASPRR